MLPRLALATLFSDSRKALAVFPIPVRHMKPRPTLRSLVRVRVPHNLTSSLVDSFLRLPQGHQTSSAYGTYLRGQATRIMASRAPSATPAPYYQVFGDEALCVPIR